MMDWELIKVLALLLALFIGLAFALLKLTPSIGLRWWTVALFVVCSYPATIATGLLNEFLFPTSPLREWVRPIPYGFVLVIAVIATGLVWILFRAVAAIQVRPRRVWWMISPLVLLCCIAGYLRATAVSSTTLNEEWYRKDHHWKKLEQLQISAHSRWLVARAELDHSVTPVAYFRRIVFLDCSDEDNNLLYFRFAAELHTFVVYCWSMPDKKFVWKAVEDHSP